MLGLSFDTVCCIVAVLLALFAAAAVAYHARVSKEPYDTAGNSFIGMLLGMSLLLFLISAFELPVAGDEEWVQWLLIGVGVVFAWLIRPRKSSE
jgi:hypothetical protein